MLFNPLQIARATDVCCQLLDMLYPHLARRRTACDPDHVRRHNLAVRRVPGGAAVRGHDDVLAAERGARRHRRPARAGLGIAWHVGRSDA